MESSTFPPKPDWLTEERIEYYREILRNTPDMLTDEEIKNWVYDGYNDNKRLNARRAYDILSHFGLLDDQEDKPNIYKH